MLRNITVLITAAGNVFMPGTTACLRNVQERKVRLVGADMNDDQTILNMFDSCYSVPRGDDPSYVDTILNICKLEHVDVVLPIMSVELNALAANRSRFRDIGTQVSVSDLSGLEIANNKLSMFWMMNQSGLPCAHFQAVYSIEGLKAAVESLGYPQKKVCLKATQGSGSRGFRILSQDGLSLNSFLHDKPSTATVSLESMLDVLSEAESFPELMVMEYLPGDEYTVDLVADKGKVLYIGCRKSLRMENSIMLDSIVVDSPAACELCSNVTEMLKLDGNIGFDLKNDATGNPYILECNPRITAGIPVFEHAGMNLPYLNLKRLLGEELPVCQPKYGTIVKRRWTEMSTDRQ